MHVSTSGVARHVEGRAARPADPEATPGVDVAEPAGGLAVRGHQGDLGAGGVLGVQGLVGAPPGPTSGSGRRSARSGRAGAPSPRCRRSGPGRRTTPPGSCVLTQDSVPGPAAAGRCCRRGRRARGRSPRRRATRTGSGGARPRRGSSSCDAATTRRSRARGRPGRRPTARRRRSRRPSSRSPSPRVRARVAATSSLPSASGSSLLGWSTRRKKTLGWREIRVRYAAQPRSTRSRSGSVAEQDGQRGRR